MELLEKQLIDKFFNVEIPKKSVLEFFKSKYPHIFFAYLIKRTFSEDWNLEIVIDGNKGVGKSYLGFKILETFTYLDSKEKYSQDIIKKSFIVPLPVTSLSDKEEINLIVEQIKEALEDDNIKLIVFDEAGDLLFTYDRMTKEAKLLVKILRKVRKYKKSFIFIHPHIFELNPNIKYRSFSLWIHGLYRVYNKYSRFVVLRGIDYKKEFVYSLDHIKHALDVYNIQGWFKNKYYLFSFNFNYNPDDYSNYKELLREKQQELILSKETKIYGVTIREIY